MLIYILSGRDTCIVLPYARVNVLLMFAYAHVHPRVFYQSQLTYVLCPFVSLACVFSLFNFKRTEFNMRRLCVVFERGRLCLCHGVCNFVFESRKGFQRLGVMICFVSAGRIVLRGCLISISSRTLPTYLNSKVRGHVPPAPVVEAHAAPTPSTSVHFA